MDEDNSTDGLPTSDLFNLTAPNNEYLTDIQSSSSTSVEFLPLETYNPIKIPNTMQEPVVSEKIRTIERSLEIQIKKDNEYSKYVNTQEIISNFSRLLENFLFKYFELADHKPISCELTMFIFPGEEYKEPMIKILYPDSNKFNNLNIRDNIEKEFKIYLAKNSEDLQQFKTFRRIQKKFRFVILRE